jgi:hypothetical protein
LSSDLRSDWQAQDRQQKKSQQHQGVRVAVKLLL